MAEGADSTIVWQYKFSQLRGSSDDGKSKLKLHFQDHETRAIETKVSNIYRRTDATYCYGFLLIFFLLFSNSLLLILIVCYIVVPVKNSQSVCKREKYLRFENFIGVNQSPYTTHIQKINC